MRDLRLLSLKGKSLKESQSPWQLLDQQLHNGNINDYNKESQKLSLFLQMQQLDGV